MASGKNEVACSHVPARRPAALRLQRQRKSYPDAQTQNGLNPTKNIFKNMLRISPDNNNLLIVSTPNP
jgi:hypothetical protein